VRDKSGRKVARLNVYNKVEAYRIDHNARRGRFD
jgi:hypothetical protein